jgi:DNA-directed RNA polymerase subunit RPC12/RpoP
MTRMDDHEDAEGNLDWASYRAAQVANGEKCRKCGDHIMSFGADSFGPRSCSSCQQMGGTEEAIHPSLVRCPKCGETWNPVEGENFELFSDGEHDVSCHECGHDFIVSTRVSFSFTSPERLPEEDEYEDEED